MSDDLRPPSLRDTRSVEDVVRHHNLLLSKLAPGLFGGRSRIPDPVELEGPSVDGDEGSDGDSDEPEWWDEDRYVITGPGTVTWTLTHVPVPESLFIRWHPGDGPGLTLVAPEDWTLGDNGQTLTIPDPDGDFVAGDVLSAQYQFTDIVADDTLLIDASDSSTSTDAWTMPTNAQDGDLLIAIGMLSTGRDVATLNGYQLIGHSSSVTHAAHTEAGGPFTYRLGVWARIKPPGSSPVPVLNAVGFPSAVCVMLSFTGPTQVTAAAFDTVADSTTADAPAATPGGINIWGAISDQGALDTSEGVIRENHSGAVGEDIALMVSTGAGTGAVPATSTTTAGWCVATLSAV